MKKVIFIMLLLTVILHNKSQSQVTVENATDKTIHICIGWIHFPEGSSAVNANSWSEGWWTISPYETKTIKNTCPSDRSIFYYAKSTDGKAIWEGSPDEYGGGVPDYFRVASEEFTIKNPEYDSNVKYPADYWKIFRKKKVTEGGFFTSPSVNIYLTL